MADALCGPSTALQSFQKHTSVDRTLQQDRLRAHATPGQGFRSADLRAGALDADFAAFESGQPFHSQAQLPLSPIAGPSHFRPSPALSQDATSSWASDFSKLRLTSPSHPIPQSQFRQEAPLQRSQIAGAGWHAECIRQQQSRSSPSITSSQQSYRPPSYGYTSQMPMAFDNYGANQFSPQQPLQDLQQDLQAGASLDDTAFETAFAQAESEQTNDLVEAAARTMEMVEEQKRQREDFLDLPEDIKIGSDLIAERETPQNQQQEKAEADELARTAGDLINALKHDQSEKFQQSQFLSLMRRLRDREVEVKGDDLKETVVSPKELRDDADSFQPLHPGGRYYPEQSPPPHVQYYNQLPPPQSDAVDAGAPFSEVSREPPYSERIRRIIQDSGHVIPENASAEDISDMWRSMNTTHRASRGPLHNSASGSSSVA